MSHESIGTTDQKGDCDRLMTHLLASAERELSAFFTAINEMFGAEKARRAAEEWIEELERTDWPNEALVIDWRRVTIAAAAKLAYRHMGQLSRN
jgi:hypothetical protein